MENKTPNPEQNNNSKESLTPFAIFIGILMFIILWGVPAIPSFILTCKVFHLGGIVALIVFGSLYAFFERVISFLISMIIVIIEAKQPNK